MWGAAIGDVVELVRPDRAGRLIGEAARGMDEVAGIGERRGRDQHKLRAQRAQGVHLLAALGFRHDDDSPVARERGDQRRAAYPGIAGGPSTRVRRLERPALLGVAEIHSAGCGPFTDAPGLATRTCRIFAPRLAAGAFEPD
jgi:hypothetical protein